MKKEEIDKIVKEYRPSLFFEDAVLSQAALMFSSKSIYSRGIAIALLTNEKENKHG